MHFNPVTRVFDLSNRTQDTPFELFLEYTLSA